nr:hypothetical protein [Fodinicola feengrottensis]
MLPLAAGEVLFVVTGVAHLCAILLLTLDVRRGRQRPGADWTDPLGCFVAGGLVAGGAGMDLWTVGVVTVPAAVVALLVTWRAADFRPAATVAWASLLASTVTGIVVAFLHLFGMTASLTTAILIGAGLVISVLRTPSSLMQTFENWEVALRRVWRHSRDPRTGAVPAGGGRAFRDRPGADVRGTARNRDRHPRRDRAAGLPEFRGHADRQQHRRRATVAPGPGTLRTAGSAFSVPARGRHYRARRLAR